MKQYILSVVASCFCCALLRSLSGKLGLSNQVIQSLCGIALAITVIAPLAEVKLGDLASYVGSIESSAEHFAETGTNISSGRLKEVIKQKTESYILEKASPYGCDITVDLQLTEDAVPVPSGVCITGTMSPYVRSYLAEVLETDLGISKEDQQWINQN